MKHMMYLQVNKLARAASAAAVVGALACSTGPRPSQSSAAQAAPETHKPTTSKVESAIASNCRLSTVGLPCDPDGAGDATECQGVCWIDDAAFVSCLPVAQVNLTVTDLNGRICGDVEGRDCGQSCENGACVEKNARLGTACRPNNNSSTCEGVCTLIGGEPACDEITVCSNVGISADGCSLTACNFESYEDGCIEYTLENSVCEASQVPVIEAGVSSEPADAAVSADAGDAASNFSDAATGVADAAPNQTSTSSESTPAMSEARPDAAAARSDAGESSEPVGDGGAVFTPYRSPTKVVGGACSTAPGRAGAGGVVLMLAALGLVGTWRRRSRAGK